MTSKSNVNGSDWLKSTILQQYFGLGILPLKKLLLWVFIDFQFTLWLNNLNDWVERLKLGLNFSDVSEGIFGSHFLENPLETLKLNKSSLVGNDFKTNVNFLSGFDNKVLVLLIFYHIEIFVSVLNEDFKVSNSDVLDEGIVKGKAYSDGFLDITDSCITVDNERRYVIAVDTINKLFFLTVCAVE